MSPNNPKPSKETHLGSLTPSIPSMRKVYFKLSMSPCLLQPDCEEPPVPESLKSSIITVTDTEVNEDVCKH
jgi:hypothetical protein